jgi:hypothetical protein
MKTFFLSLAGLTLAATTGFGQNVNVNPGAGSYPTMQAAFDAINLGTHTGAITVDVVGNTTETATASLNASGVGAASYTSVTVVPSGGARTVTGSVVGAIIKLNGADNVVIDGRIAGAGRNLTVSNTNTSAATAAIWLASVAAGNGASNNVIRNLEIAAGVTAFTSSNASFGIIMCGITIGVAVNGDDNDNNSFIANRIIRARYGIVTRGTTTNLNIAPIVTDNIIGPTAFGPDEIGKVGIFMQADTAATVRGNTVQFVGGTLANTLAGADRIGIAIGNESWSMAPATITSNSYTVTKNVIHDIVDERTFSAMGINLATTGGGSPTNNLVANNFIYNVRANGTAGDQSVGIGIAGGHTDTVAFNSISMTGDVDPGAAAASSMFGSGIRIANASSATHANLTLMDNSVYMDLSSSSTAANRYYAISGNAAAYSFGTGGENYNNYYIVPANPQSQTGGLGTVSGNTLTTQFATLAAWQAAYTAAQDANSIQANPLYLSNTGDLHIGTGSPNIDVGLTLAGITDDIDAQFRPNGATSDIGADEFYALPGTLQFSSTTYSGNEGTTATITVNRTGGSFGTVTVDVTLTDGTATGGAACGAGVDYVNPGVQTLTFPDSNTTQTFNVTLCSDAVVDPSEAFTLTLSNPTGGASIGANNPATMTITDVPPALCGSFNVPGDYPSLTNAGGIFAALNLSGASCNITINITADLAAETGANALNQLAGGFTVLIRPSGAPRTVSGSSGAGGLIILNGADNVTIDGTLVPNMIEGTSALTIRNTNNTATNVISLINDASNNDILNCTVEGGVTTGVILLGGGTTTGNDNNLISGNVVRDRTDAAGVAFNGVIVNGTSAAIANSDNVISNNLCLNFIQSGILLFAGNENSTVTGNEITQSVSRTTAMFSLGVQVAFGTNLISQNTIHDISTSGTSSTFGIFLADARGTTVSRNQIYNFPSVAGATGRISGIEFDGASGLPSSVTVVNNMVSLVPAVATNQNVRGIYDFGFGGNTFTAYYNSIYIGGTSSGTAASWALDRGTFAPTTYTAQNNLCYNNRTGGGANHFAAGDDSANTGTFVSDYNFFVGTGTTAANFFDYGTAAGGTPVSFAAWQTGPPARDANSTADIAANFNPVNFFVNANAGDLHLVAGAPPSNLGTPIGGVTIDFDGQTRSATTPDIGADEVAAPLAATGAVSRKNHGGTNRDINLPLSGNSGIECRGPSTTANPSVPINPYQIIFSFANDVTVSGSTTPPPSAATLALGPGGTGTVSSIIVDNSGAVNFVTVNLSGVSDEQSITLTLQNVSDGTSSGDIEVNMSVLIGDTQGIGNYSVGAGDISFQKQQSNVGTVNATNFRADVTVNNAINAADINSVKGKSGNGLLPQGKCYGSNTNCIGPFIRTDCNDCIVTMGAPSWRRDSDAQCFTVCPP